MKSKSWKNLLTIILIVVLAMALTVGALADEEGTDDHVSFNGMTAGKSITVQDDGTYVIDLEAFATGEATFTTVTVPADIILVLDVSGSMKDKMGSDTVTYSYTARTSQAYSYNSYGNNTYYYLHTDGEYYQVSRGGSSSSRRYLRYRVGSTYWYLNGTGSTTTETRFNGNNTTIYTGVLYERTATTVEAPRKIDALKAAVNGFIDEVAKNNAGVTDPNYLSRIAIVKFAMGARGSYGNYQNQIGNEYDSDGYNYTQVVADLDYVAAATYGHNAEWWKGKVTPLTATGATAADYGMGYANAIMQAYPLSETDKQIGRQRVVVMFTDGEPNHYNGFDGNVADAAITSSKAMKDAGALVYSIAVYNGASNAEPPTTNINKYLHGVSSNYPNATGYNALGTRGAGNYYFVAENAGQLAQIFKEIGQSSGSTTTELGTEAVMKDIVSSSFTLPEGATEDDIHIKVVRWNSTIHDWGTGEGYEFTPEQWATACTSYGAETAEYVSVTISEDGKTIDVVGFDYAKHFKATSAEQDDNEHDVVGGVNKNTAKVVVSFAIQAKPSAVTGGSVATNGEDSGIYINGEATEAVIKFPVPQVVFTPVTYVVDYVTSDTSTDTKASTIKLDYSSVLKNVQMLDDPSDDYLIGEDASAFTYTIYKGQFGTISFGDDEVDVQRKYVRYAPTTMNWTDYDRIFIKGESASSSNLDVWAMLCVIPANSVFYEDTYISQTKTVTYNDQTVTIEYTGINYEGDWGTVGTEGKNQTQHAGDDMGWIEGLADDSGYANDMAHTSSTAKAKASFTFSGTGVDIYSRTNGSTGTIMVSVKSNAADNASGKKVSKAKIIDTKAAAGDFFAVPVCTFTDLPYGQYTATITVTAGGQKEGRMTFYLDGIRVYNPIQPHESDETVQTMYGEENLGAVFTEVRSLLGTGATSAALYIDEHTTSEEVTNVAAIQAAAQALADAQAARDAYVESTITPAKNAVSAEEYALSTAEANVNNTKNIYDVALEAYQAAQAAADADPENTELQEAAAAALKTKNDKEADWEAAKTALTAAQTHYDNTMPGLQADLQAAIDGKAEYDAAVEAAREAYDEVNNGVEVGYTTENVVADYNKDGPNSELYLDKNQQVAINVESGKTYYIGLRSLNGEEVTALINGKEVKLSHTVDLYYNATTDAGTIVIKNTSDGILAITKLRTTNGTSGETNTTSGTRLASTEETLAYVRSLASMPVTAYDGDVLTQEDVYTEEEPATEPEPATETEPEIETEPETEMLDEGSIVIENPETTEPDPVEEVEEPEPESNDSGMSSILWSFFNFFRRRP